MASRGSHIAWYASLAIGVLAVLATLTTWTHVAAEGNPDHGQARKLADDDKIVSHQIDLPGISGLALVVYKEGNTDSCRAAFVLSVGTAMTMDQYLPTASEIAKLGYTVFVVDPVPGDFVKFHGHQLDDSIDAVKRLVKKKSSEYVKCPDFKKWIIGGHSAGGWAAYQAITKTPSLADATFSLDPFYAKTNPLQKGNALEGTSKKPGVYWGFDVTTCGVTVEDAARAFYEKTQPGALYLVDNSNFKCKASLPIHPPALDCPYGHCSFATNGRCGACDKKECGLNLGNCITDPQPEFYRDIAKSFDKLVQYLEGKIGWDAVAINKSDLETKMKGSYAYVKGEPKLPGRH